LTHPRPALEKAFLDKQTGEKVVAPASSATERSGRERRTRADTLKDAIADAILSGELTPGQRLDEISVAKRFSVSRTPVREALKQLAAMELVEIRPHRGAVVAALQPSRVVELFEAMSEIEAVCARLAARRMSREERLRLEAAWSACDQALQAGELERIQVSNQTFHEAIYAAAGNMFLADAAHALRRKIAPLFRAQFAVTGRADTSAAEHREIMAALRAGDDDAAEAGMRRHLGSVSQAFVGWLERASPDKLAS
jgi:DNA-binding GntR family transcriptional regulator